MVIIIKVYIGKNASQFIAELDVAAASRKSRVSDASRFGWNRWNWFRM